jgi:hypothetical protein
MGFLGAASPELEWPLIPWDRPKDQNLLPAGGQLLPACPESVLGGQKKKSIPASASSCRKPLLFLFLADDHTGTTTETCPSFIHIVRCNKVRLLRLILKYFFNYPSYHSSETNSLFVWLVVDGWCWFVLREKYCWLVAGGWFVLREKYGWLVADKPSEQGVITSIKYEIIIKFIP